MDVISQRDIYLKRVKQNTMDKLVAVVTDYNGGMNATEIAKRHGISRVWVYKLLERAKTITL